MKKMLAAAIALLFCSIAFAQTSAQSKGLVAQLHAAEYDYAVADYDAYLNASKVGVLPQAWKSTHDKGKAAYEAWIVGKIPAQVADAKKLYAAWLTRLDAMMHINGDPNSVDQTPAGVAFEQAVNEFNIDNPE